MGRRSPPRKSVFSNRSPRATPATPLGERGEKKPSLQGQAGLRL
jgi:hypothetical protein